MKDQKSNFLVDYYFTKRSERNYDYDIVEKIKIRACCSDSSLGESIDVFIPKSDMPKERKPQSHDMIFFTNEKRFYEAVSVDDIGDVYLINVNTIKQKEH